MNSKKRPLGPLQCATLMHPRPADLVQTYRRFLHLTEHDAEPLSAPAAALLGDVDLTGAGCRWLGSADSVWLRIVEAPMRYAPPPTVLRHHGWLSLEISVQNLDELAAELADSPFEILGAPAPLAVGDAICAMQVAGPAGEVLYLTEIREALPPFELTSARHAVDALFIAVLAVPERSRSAEFYQGLGGDEPLLFDTRIGVLNRTWGRDEAGEYPVATVQLHGATLLEIDELPQAAARPSRCCGVASVAVEVRSLDALSCEWAAVPAAVADFPWCGRRGAAAIGPAGERIEFIEAP
ncbi:MAG: hypothetical protein ISN29_07955 [Gammaproteobacteria bacterium AqS3]|nr:hypothetical protein [Gammaproteobacteria bacterium AqS3]